MISTIFKKSRYTNKVVASDEGIIYRSGSFLFVNIVEIITDQFFVIMDFRPILLNKKKPFRSMSYEIFIITEYFLCSLH